MGEGLRGERPKGGKKRIVRVEKRKGGECQAKRCGKENQGRIK